MDKIADCAIRPKVVNTHGLAYRPSIRNSGECQYGEALNFRMRWPKITMCQTE